MNSTISTIDRIATTIAFEKALHRFSRAVCAGDVDSIAAMTERLERMTDGVA